MENRDWDMYDYIKESGQAVRNIVDNQDSIFGEALEYCKGKKIDQMYILGIRCQYPGYRYLPCGKKHQHHLRFGQGKGTGHDDHCHDCGGGPADYRARRPDGVHIHR